MDVYIMVLVDDVIVAAINIMRHTYNSIKTCLQSNADEERKRWAQIITLINRRFDFRYSLQFRHVHVKSDA